MSSDPSLHFIKPTDNFIKFNSLLKDYKEKTIIPLSSSPITVNYNIIQPINNNLYQELLNIQKGLDDINPTEYEQARDKLDLLINFASLFSNRAGLKLANLDALYHFTSFSLEQPQDSRPLRCLDLGAAPGAWTQYLQYRIPLGYNYLVSYKSGLQYDLSYLQNTRTNIMFANDNSKQGDLLTEGDAIISYIRALEPEGLDLIVADAAPGEQSVREEKQSPFFVAEIYITLSVAKENSHAVFKIFNAQQPITQQLIWLLTKCYKKVYISKPATSRLVNDELYIVAKYCHSFIARREALEIISFLYTNKQYNSFCQCNDNTMATIKKISNNYLTSQKDNMLQVIQELVENNSVLLPLHYSTKLYNAWVIPSIRK